MNCTLEIYHQGQWHSAAVFEPAATVQQQGIKVADFLCDLGCERSAVLALWRELVKKVPQLPGVMQRCGVDTALITQLDARIDHVALRLQEAL
ncbi:MAG: hypothetical protein R3E95_20935 [Thiolinea sp.]